MISIQVVPDFECHIAWEAEMVDWYIIILNWVYIIVRGIEFETNDSSNDNNNTKVIPFDCLLEHDFASS